MTTYQLPHHRDKPFGAAGPIPGAWILDYIQDRSSDAATWLRDEQIHQRFIERYKEWLTTTELNTWRGLDQFQHGVVMQGTTETFDKFYMANRDRRFRCFRGEYMYHQLAWRNHWPDQWAYIDEADLDANDTVVISMPFSDTGNTHAMQYIVLEECERLGIPVLLDLAYFGICSGLDFNLDYECIQAVSFSLSKSFPVAHARIGMRLTRKDDDDPGFVNHKSGYVNRVACGLGIELMNRVSPDWVFTQYRDQQLEFCETLGVVPSQCVIFGLGDQAWSQYNRGTITNRLSFHRYLDTGQLPN
jgi:hypothetical protein